MAMPALRRRSRVENTDAMNVQQARDRTMPPDNRLGIDDHFDRADWGAAKADLSA